MKNKVLVRLAVPEIFETYNVYLPINKKVGNVIELLSKAIFELTNGNFSSKDTNMLYSSVTGEKYPVDKLIRETDIRNGAKIILM